MKYLLIFWGLSIFTFNTFSQSQEKLKQMLDKATIYEQQNEWKKAQIEFDKIIKNFPDNAYLYFHRGYANEMLEKYDDAIIDFTKVLTLDSTYYLARTNRAYAFQMLGQYEKAKNDYSEELRINPNKYSIEHIGYVKFLMKDYEGALQDLSTAIAGNNTNSIAYLHRAQVYFALGEKSLGCRDLSEAKKLKIESEYPDLKPAYQKMELECLKLN